MDTYIYTYISKHSQRRRIRRWSVPRVAAAPAIGGRVAKHIYQSVSIYLSICVYIYIASVVESAVAGTPQANGVPAIGGRVAKRIDQSVSIYLSISVCIYTYIYI